MEINIKAKEKCMGKMKKVLTAAELILGITFIILAVLEFGKQDADMVGAVLDMVAGSCFLLSSILEIGDFVKLASKEEKDEK